jgi:hypothetical protein
MKDFLKSVIKLYSKDEVAWEITFLWFMVFLALFSFLAFFIWWFPEIAVAVIAVIGATLATFILIGLMAFFIHKAIS